MKKLVLTLVAGAFISASMVSCNKCGSCSNGSTGEFCQKDSKVLYDAAKNGCETGGGTWEVK